MWREEYKDCLEYIDGYWSKITYKPSRMRLRYRLRNIPLHVQNAKLNVNLNPGFIKLPYYYFVPNDNKFKFIFYWDSFFMFRGIMGTKREWLMKEMVDNFIYLFNTFHIIPNFSAPASMGRSQPPFFSSMILDSYLTPLHAMNHYQRKGISRSLYLFREKSWLKKAITVAKQEYELVWIDKENAYNHHVEGYNLARYGDRDIGYSQSSEIESGWDMTSRFYNRCDHFLPVDLNNYLYKYEKDFAFAARLFNDEKEADIWEERASKRKQEMYQYMWDEEEGFFYDYGYKYQSISHYFSLASFVPLWAGLATAKQARRIIHHLPKFETSYGLLIGAKVSLAKSIDFQHIQQRYRPAIEQILKPKQWDYPNIWSPLEYLTVIGLLRYGFIDEAKRIMQNSVKTHAALYRKYHTFFEKINGETGDTGNSGALYSDQTSFGWTNTAFYRYINILDALESQKTIYTNPQKNEPPYDLAILH